MKLVIIYAIMSTLFDHKRQQMPNNRQKETNHKNATAVPSLKLSEMTSL